METKKVILHLSMTPLEFDARVKRSISALNTDRFYSDVLAPNNGLKLYPLTFFKKIKMACVFVASSLFGKNIALKGFWLFTSHRDALNKIINKGPDVIHAHDWDALPIAVKASEILNIPVVYDSHEFASQMHHERFLWRLTMSKFIKLIETVSIKKCSGIITVSDGIAKVLQNVYKLKNHPTVIRNTPEYTSITSLKPASMNKVILHYHGILAKGRGIKIMLEVLAHLPDNYLVRLIGPVRQRNYVNKLHALTRDLGIVNRVEIIDAVKPQELVNAASDAHFGFCILKNNTIQNKYALPNKIFEYINAGLFVVASNGNELEKIVVQNGAGITVDQISSSELASKILAISMPQLKVIRNKNLKTAFELNWNFEKIKLIQFYEKLIPCQ